MTTTVAGTPPAITTATPTSPSWNMFERMLSAMLVLGQAPRHLSGRLDERRRNSAGPIVIIFVVTIAVLLTLAAAVSAAVVIYCATKGMNFEWYVKTSWFEVKVACQK